MDVAEVWSGHPVDFSLVTRGDRQYVAYYDAARQMTVATRTLGSTSWETVTLPTTLGWDSHNHVRLTLDERGHVHVAGNMHNVPLIYFRTTTPFDISTLAQVASMVGTNESSVTYPRFFAGPGGACSSPIATVRAARATNSSTCTTPRRAFGVAGSTHHC